MPYYVAFGGKKIDDKMLINKTQFDTVIIELAVDTVNVHTAL